MLWWTRLSQQQQQQQRQQPSQPQQQQQQQCNREQQKSVVHTSLHVTTRVRTVSIESVYSSKQLDERRAVISVSERTAMLTRKSDGNPRRMTTRTLCRNFAPEQRERLILLPAPLFSRSPSEGDETHPTTQRRQRVAHPDERPHLLACLLAS